MFIGGEEDDISFYTWNSVMHTRGVKLSKLAGHGAISAERNLDLPILTRSSIEKHASTLTFPGRAVSR